MTNQLLAAATRPAPQRRRSGRRLHLALFLPLCLVASAAGGAATFVAFALITDGGGTTPSDSVIACGLLATIGGAVLPPLLLALARGRRGPEIEDPPAADDADRLQAAAAGPAEPAFAAAAAPHVALPPRLRYAAAVAAPSSSAEPALVHETWPEPFVEPLATAARRGDALRIVDWGFFAYPLAFALAIGLSGNYRDVDFWLPVVIANLLCCAMELAGVVVSDDAVTYPVRLTLLRFYAVPLFRRTISLDEVWEATAETRYRQRGGNPFPRIRLLYLSGARANARVWFSSKGRRDWLFAQLRRRAPHVQQYRGR